MSLALLGRGNLGIRSPLGVDAAVGINALGIVAPRITASEPLSTFTAADYTPAADETPTTLTFTLKDSTDTAIAGASVTYA